jgi:hypothetical protein
MSILVAGEGLVFHYRLVIRDRTAGGVAGKRGQLLILAMNWTCYKEAEHVNCRNAPRGPFS